MIDALNNIFSDEEKNIFASDYLKDGRHDLVTSACITAAIHNTFDYVNEQLTLWHEMDEEPLMTGVILYSETANKIYDGSYIGDGRFDINGLQVHKSEFTAWCQRGNFFKKTGLRNFINNK